MSRTKLPDAHEIVKKADRKNKDFQNQRSDLDDPATRQYLQTDRKSVHTVQGQDVRGKDEPKPVGSGMIGFMNDQDVSVLHARPFGRILAFGGQDAERHVSDKLEPWGNTAVWLSARGVKVWDKGNLDLVNVGRFWSKVLPAPQFWAGEELEKKAVVLNDLVKRGASEEEIKRAKDDIAEWKSIPANWPIAWIYVSPRGTWPIYDERGIAEVVEIRKMSRDSVEEYFGTVPDDLKDKDDIDVIEYANDIHVATVLPSQEGIVGAAKRLVGAGRESKFLKEPWEHGLGVNPYVLIEGIPLPDNDEGWTWRGGAFHMRHLMPAVDEVMSDYRTSVHRNTITPYFVKVNLEERAAHGIEEEGIDVKANETVKMYCGAGWDEDAGIFPVPAVNPDALRFVDMAQAFAAIGGLDRPALTGQTSSGQAAVTLETARQIATGELKIPHASLEEGFAAIVERHLRAVTALSERYPNALQEITVRVEDKEHKSKPISVGPKDVKGYEHLVRGKIKLNIQINEGANVTNARMSTDPQHPMLSDVSALQRYYDHENPVEELDRIAEQRFTQGLIEISLTMLQRRATGGMEAMGAEGLATLVEQTGSLPLAAQQAMAMSYGGNPPPGMMEGIARTQANVTRAGRGQQPSELTGMNIRPPGESTT